GARLATAAATRQDGAGGDAALRRLERIERTLARLLARHDFVAMQAQRAIGDALDEARRPSPATEYLDATGRLLRAAADGAARVGPGLGGFLDHEVESLLEAAIDVDAPNLRLIPGSARSGAANINAGQKLRLLRAIANLSADVVVVDVGAGAAYNTIDLFTGAD